MHRSHAKNPQTDGEDFMLSVDIGSSGIRCCTYTIGSKPCRVLGSVSSDSLAAIISSDGVNSDPLDVVHIVENTIDSCLRLLRTSGHCGIVKAVGFSCLSMNLVGVDLNGIPLTPLITYTGSNSCVASLLRSSLGKEKCEEMHRQTGSPIHSSYALVQLLSLLRTNDFTNVQSWQTISGMLLSRWTGERDIPMSFCEASWTGMLNLLKLQWDSEVLDILKSKGFPIESLPILADFSEFEKSIEVGTSYANRWPELVGAKFFLGLGDGACASLGSGCIDSNSVSVTIGTSAAARTVLHISEFKLSSELYQQISQGLWCYRIDRKRMLLGGALSDGGSIFEWACKMAGASKHEDIDKLVESASLLTPAGHGLIFLPFLSGERALGWQEGATGTLSGLTRKTTMPEILRVAMESVCYRLAEIVELMEPFLAEDAPAIASGTALRESVLWRHIVSDTLDRRLFISSEDRATSLGLAFLISEHFQKLSTEENCDLAIKITTGAPDKSPFMELYVPSLGAVIAYKEARSIQQKLYKKLYG